MDVSITKSILTMRCLNDQRINGELCDVVIVVGNKKHNAHRNVLAANSQYFRAMFTGNLVESRVYEVALKETDAEAVEMMINFIYTGKLAIDAENVEALTTVSSMLQLHDVKETCCDFMAGSLSPSNCLGIRRFADAHFCLDLIKQTDLYIRRNFENIVISDEFLNLDLNRLLEFISRDEFVARASEEIIYKAAVSWLNYNKEDRQKHIATVTENIRACLLTPRFFVEMINMEPLGLRNAKFCQLLDFNAKAYYVISDERSAESPEATVPRNCQEVPVLFAVGSGRLNDSRTAYISTVERYDVRTSEWSIMSPMVQTKHSCGVTAAGKVLYLIGGSYNEKYDLLSNEQLRIAKVVASNARRYLHGVVVLKGFLYVLGGCDGASGILDTVQRCDLGTNQLEDLAPLTAKKRSMGVGKLAGQIYCCGGATGENEVLNTVERYDPKAGLWEPLSPMHKKRYGSSCAALKGFLYVVGGTDDCEGTLAACERYDPHAEAWYLVAPMKQARYRAGLTVWQGLIYAVGGHDKKGKVLRSAEMYNPEMDSWTECAPAVENAEPVILNRPSVSFAVTF